MKETPTLLKSETKLSLRPRISSYMLRIFQRHSRLLQRFLCKRSSELEGCFCVSLLTDLPIRNLPTSIVNLGLGFHRFPALREVSEFKQCVCVITISSGLWMQEKNPPGEQVGCSSTFQLFGK